MGARWERTGVSAGGGGGAPPELLGVEPSSPAPARASGAPASAPSAAVTMSSEGVDIS